MPSLRRYRGDFGCELSLVIDAMVSSAEITVELQWDGYWTWQYICKALAYHLTVTPLLDEGSDHFAIWPEW